MAARRGEVWWAALEAPRGSGPGYRRPVVIVQSNRFNESRIQTIVVVAVTSNLALAEAPGNVRVRPHDTGLARVSVINVSQLLTISRDYLVERAGVLPARVMNQVADGVRLVLSL